MVALRDRPLTWWVSLAVLVALLAGVGAVTAMVLWRGDWPYGTTPFAAVLCGLPLVVLLAGYALVVRSQSLAERHLTVQVPEGPVTPGEELAVSVRVDVPKGLHARSATVRLVGKEEAWMRIADAEREEERPFLDQTIPILRELPGREHHLISPGSHVYTAKFPLPGDAPPSYLGYNAAVSYDVEVRVDIPRALDFVKALAVQVRPASWRSPPSRKGEDGVTRAGPVGLEIEVPEEVAAGAVLQGRVRVKNPDGRSIRRITVAFGSVEAAHSGNRRMRRFAPLATKTFPSPGGDALEFELKVPKTLTPGYRGTLTSLRYAVQAHADVAAAVDTKVLRTVVVRLEE